MSGKRKKYIFRFPGVENTHDTQHLLVLMFCIVREKYQPQR